MTDTPTGVPINPDEITVAQAAVREFINANAPGWVAGEISDAEVHSIASAVVTAIEAWRNGKVI